MVKKSSGFGERPSGRAEPPPEGGAPADDLEQALDEAVKSVAGTAGLVGETGPAALLSASSAQDDGPLLPEAAPATGHAAPARRAAAPRSGATRAHAGERSDPRTAARPARAARASRPAPDGETAPQDETAQDAKPAMTTARGESEHQPEHMADYPVENEVESVDAAEGESVSPVGNAPEAEVLPQVGAADADEIAAAYNAATDRQDAAQSADQRAGAGQAADTQDKALSARAAPAAQAQAGQAQGSADAPAAAPPAAAAADERLDTANPLTATHLPERLAENIERIEMLGQRLMRALASQPVHAPGVDGPGPEFYATTTQAWMKMAAQQPARIIEQQVQFWGETLRHVARAQQAFALRGFAAPEDESDSKDRRFANPLWRTNPFFSFVRQQYLINAGAMKKAIADLDIPEGSDRHRVEWFTRQIIDMLSPTNFLATNPDALEKAIATEGESLVRGLENLVQDIEANRGDLVVSLADRNAFRVGENIGTTAGEVVHRSPLFELIQFHPITEQVHKTPLVVFPPWINKFYIMDLKPQNSLLRWIVEQGHTVFVVSWKNPDESYANTGMEDYVSAYLEAMDKVAEVTGERQMNAVGYCIGGTTLSLALGVLDSRGDDRVKSATLFTTLTDFRDPGDFVTFLQDDFIAGIEGEVGRVGYLSAQLMQRTMSFLRANDLVWAPAIRNYMLGEAPPAFDLLFWNGDGTNLPGRMVVEYLRGLCQANLMTSDGFPVLGTRVRLSDIKVPLCSIACEGDHIAPWLNCWAGFSQMASPDRTFILSESGHIAGIINPPSKVKYGHYTSDAGFEGTPQQWKSQSQFNPGSWWPRWGEWLERFAGELVPARAPQQSLAPAPGAYVHEKM